MYASMCGCCMKVCRIWPKFTSTRLPNWLLFVAFAYIFTPSMVTCDILPPRKKPCILVENTKVQGRVRIIYQNIIKQDIHSQEGSFRQNWYSSEHTSSETHQFRQKVSAWKCSYCCHTVNRLWKYCSLHVSRSKMSPRRKERKWIQNTARHTP